MLQSPHTLTYTHAMVTDVARKRNLTDYYFDCTQQNCKRVLYMLSLSLSLSLAIASNTIGEKNPEFFSCGWCVCWKCSFSSQNLKCSCTLNIFSPVQKTTQTVCIAILIKHPTKNIWKQLQLSWFHRKSSYPSQILRISARQILKGPSHPLGDTAEPAIVKFC